MNITRNLLTENEYSRPRKLIKTLEGIVIHWVANPGTSARANRNYFENRKNGRNGYGSAHYIIDIDGSIIQCIPEKEVAYHVGSKEYTYLKEKLVGNSNPNNHFIGIEMCHPDETGAFSEKSIISLKELIDKICKENGFKPSERLFTHKEIVGWKDCPKWFCDNPIEWLKFKNEADL